MTSGEMLDLSWEDYLKIKPNQVFASGSAPDSPEGLHMTGTGKTLYWVAVKGAMQDWAMYCEWAPDPWYIRNNGQKVHDPQNIKNVIKDDRRVMDQYRFR